LAVTMTAGWQKIFHEDRANGFFAAAKVPGREIAVLEQALAVAEEARVTPQANRAGRRKRGTRKPYFALQQRARRLRGGIFHVGWWRDGL